MHQQIRPIQLKFDLNIYAFVYMRVLNSFFSIDFIREYSSLLNYYEKEREGDGKRDVKR
jgi:hypothetical protein